jgi:hypothetical protein
MKIRHTTDGLEIKHTPGCIWIFGAFFFIIGSMLLYGLLGGFSNYDDIKTWEIAVGLIISLSIISVGIWQVLSNPATLTKINGLEKTVTQIEKGFFRRNITQYKFADVIKFEIIEEKDSEGDSFYYLVFRTTQGEKVKISSTGIQVKEYVAEIKDEVNKYLEREKLLDK